MSCREGEPCLEARRRKTAIIVLVLMGVLFITLSLFSFVPERGQTLPTEVTFGAHDGVDGRRVFQAYNCMGCHTIMGNGAYLGPDLTNIYKDTGPAWLAAFISSAGVGQPKRQCVLSCSTLWLLPMQAPMTLPSIWLNTQEHRSVLLAVAVKPL